MLHIIGSLLNHNFLIPTPFHSRTTHIMIFKRLFVAALSVFLISSVLFDLAQARTPEQACRAVKNCLKRLDAGKKCKTLPVPDSAVVPPTPDPFELKRLRQGVWQYNDGTYLTLILRNGSRLAMIDVPASPESNKEDGSKTKLTDAAEQVMNGTAPKHIDIVYSHEHYDHIGATNLFVDYMKMKYPSVKFSFWGTMSTKRMIENSAVQNAPLPDKIVGSEGATFSLGRGLDVHLAVVGGHAQEDLRIYIPPFEEEAGVVMYVDIVFPKYATTVNIGLSEDVGQAIRALKGILELDFEYFVPGHIFPGTRKDIELNIAYLEDLLDAAMEGLDTVGPEEFAAAGLNKGLDPKAREFGNLWFLALSVTRGAQSDKCVRIMLEKWGCKLYGIDIVGPGHCLNAIIHVLTEY